MDLQIVMFINHFGHGTRLDIVSQYISLNRSMLIIRSVVILVVLILKKKYWRYVLFSFVLAGGLFYLTSEIGFKTLLIQETSVRPRPYVAYADSIQPIGKQSIDSSFPSSHMALTVAMCTVLIMLFPAVRPYAVLYALLMARSRIYNGMHYPSDVLVGAMIGIVCGWLAVQLSRRVFPSR